MDGNTWHTNVGTFLNDHLLHFTGSLTSNVINVSQSNIPRLFKTECIEHKQLPFISPSATSVTNDLVQQSGF